MEPKQDDSTTPTPETPTTPPAPPAPSKRPAPVDVEEDAEVVEDAPPRAPRKASRKPQATPVDLGDIFGGDVAEAANVKRAGPSKGKGKGKKEAPPPPEPTDEHRTTAAGAIQTMDAILRGWAQARYRAHFDAQTMENIDRDLALSPAKVDALAEPLARGLAENEVEIPWWGQLALAGFGIYAPALAMLATLDAVVEEKTKGPAGEVKP